ncbi:hypothetical protein Tco_0116363 [Tanacetum coccineum]
MNSFITFIRSRVIWERVHDFQLGIESYQIKVNLTALTLTFPGIEAHDPYSIVDKPTTGLIYLNNKDEKRVMYLVETVKFYDATLKKVLNEVNLRIFQSQFWKKLPQLGYPLVHKLDVKEYPHTATCECYKRGIKVQSDLKDFHEEMREIQYCLNNSFKLLCSMVKPAAKAATQCFVAKNNSKVLLLTHGSPPCNKGEQRSRGSTCKDIYFLPLQRYLPSSKRPRSLLFELTIRGKGKQRARAYGGEDELLKLGEDKV